MVTVILYGIVTPIALAVGYKPSRRDSTAFFQPTSYLPKAQKFWLVVGIVPLVLLVGSGCFFILGALASWIFGDVVKSPLGRTIVISVFAILIAWIAGRIWRKTETYPVIKAYIRAKKERVCPIIEFK